MAKYSKRIVTRIVGLLKSDTYTIAEVCKQCEINTKTFHEWRGRFPEFAKALEDAEDERKQLFVVEAKKSLLKKVQGYTVQEKRTVTADTGKKDENDKPIVKVKEHVVTEKYIQPDTAAIIFTLTNGDPDNWKNRMDNKVTAEVGIKSHLENLSDEELQKIVDGDEVK